MENIYRSIVPRTKLGTLNPVNKKYVPKAKSPNLEEAGNVWYYIPSLNYRILKVPFVVSLVDFERIVCSYIVGRYSVPFLFETVMIS